MVSYPSGNPMGPSMTTPHNIPQYSHQPQNGGLPVGNMTRGGPISMQAQQQSRMSTTMVIPPMNNMAPRVFSTPMTMPKHDQNQGPRFPVQNCLVAPHYGMMQANPNNRYPQAGTPQRDNYHVGSQQQYMQAGGVNPVGNNPGGLRGIPSAPTPTPTQQQEMQKQQSHMQTHGFGMPGQNQVRPQGMPNFTFRNNSQPTRAPHHRQPSTTVYPGTHPSAPMVYVVPPFSFPSFQPRTQTGYIHPSIQQQMNTLVYPYAPNHQAPCYYPPNSPSIPPNSMNPTHPSRNNQPNQVTPNPVQMSNNPGGYNNQQPNHMRPQQGLRHPGLMPQAAVPKKPSSRIIIINPDTLMEVVPDSRTQQSNSDDLNERQTPPDAVKKVEEFTRSIIAVAKQSTPESENKANSGQENNDNVTVEISSTKCDMAMYATTPVVLSSEHLPSEEVSVSSIDTPIVSALSDSPEIVPKTKIQTSSEQTATIDNNKNISNKQTAVVNSFVIPADEVVKTSDITLLNALSSQSQRPKSTLERSESSDCYAQGEQKIEPIPEAQTLVSTNGPESIAEIETLEDLALTNKGVSSGPAFRAPVLQSDQYSLQKLLIPVREDSLETVHEVDPEIIKSEEALSEVANNYHQNICYSDRAVAQINLQQLTINPRMKDLENAAVKTISDLDAANGNSELGKDNGNYIERDLKSDTTTNADLELNANHQAQDIDGDNQAQAKANDKTEPEVEKVFIPKYTYKDGQWSPFNQTGRKVYEKEFILALQHDPKTKEMPEELHHHPDLIRMKQSDNAIVLANIGRQRDTFMPMFAMQGQRGSSMAKDTRKPQTPSAKQSVRGSGQSGGGGSMNMNKIHVSLSLRSDVKLNEAENAWKPSRLQSQAVEDSEIKEQELYKKVRSVLNKLTPEKFGTLIDQVKKLEINTEEKLSKVIDLVFDKAIDEPNFSVAYAKMCKQLSVLAVPSSNNPKEVVNFRKMLIGKCQRQFETKEQASVKSLEKEVKSCDDPVKKKELELSLEEEKRKVRMKSVGNVRFIGELYKLDMLTPNIMQYCMNYLLEGEENEQKLECLCKLLNTIGAQFENEPGTEKVDTVKVLNDVCSKMWNIASRKSKNKISSRVRFMLQDVIDLRKKRWTTKNDEAPKTMGEIQKEAELQHKNIELMNATPMGGGGNRRDDRGKRGDSRRGGGSTGSLDWSKAAPRLNIDTSKLKAGMKSNTKDLKLAPASRWDGGIRSSSMTATQLTTSAISPNKFGILDNHSSDPPALRSTKDMSPTKGSLDKSSSNKYSRSNNYSASSSTSKSGTNTPTNAPTPQIEQIPIPDKQAKQLDSCIQQNLVAHIENEFGSEVQEKFGPQYHTDLIYRMICTAVDKKQETHPTFSKMFSQLLSSNIVSAEHFCDGLGKILEDPDLSVDVPLLNVYLARFILQPLKTQFITLPQLLKATNREDIFPDQRMKFLAAVLKALKDDMGPSFVRNKWVESKLKLDQWMDPEDVSRFVENNKLEYLESNTNPLPFDKSNMKQLTSDEIQRKLTELMSADTSLEVVRKWIQECAGDDSTVTRAVASAVIEFALGPQFKLNESKMDRYSQLMAVGPEKEADVLLAVQFLVHRLEHPQGVTLSIFKYLSEHDVVTQDGFLAWEKCTEPTGKALMLKSLVAFFTDIKEGDNDDSCGEDTPNM